MTFFDFNVSYPRPIVFRWKHTFHREVVVPIIKEVSCATSPPDYGTILRLDQLIRSIKFPPTLQYVDFKTAPVELLLQSQQLFLMREISRSEHPFIGHLLTIS
jgi:hypothetical protein